MEMNKMSRNELEKLIRDAERALKSIEKREMQAAKKAAEDAAAKFGFKLSELVGGTATGQKSAKAQRSGEAKYANPEDPSQTWTGKGRQPKWFKDAIEAGKSPEALAV
jgi:DNA-binding protein H-NS